MQFLMGSWVRNVIESGYHMEFSSTPRSGLMRVNPISQNSDERTALEKEIYGLLEKRAIHLIHPGHS
ncbi:hypothetical protein HOLleu_41779 [Holothuria leucospilota]|uniref:Uncharacterized protein n=1 Tax=Holothuria leucospilota TaxID=206669 RepID=A0A9Q0YEF6_HOLLE|nr:hypothetical protein HOLleu_41779 [Holothuria leucospilota]